jgi:type I restriction enzyme, S subunit
MNEFFNSPRGFYLLDTIRRQVAVAGITGRDLSSLIISMPSLQDQRRVAGVLGALDDKIDLNRRMNETLEAMARAIFRDWFVDFGPVRAKMEGRVLPRLAPEVAALFPERMEDAGLPEGWTRQPLLAFSRLLSGGTPKTEVAHYWDGEVPWASAKDVSQCGQAFLIETERRITDRGLNESSTRMIPALATVVVARGATTGRVCMLGRAMAMNQTCYALVSLESRPFWLNCMFRTLVEGLVNAAHGSVFDTITTQTFDRTAVLVPPDGLRSSFEIIVEPLFRHVLCNIEESRILADLRDLLLPKLISGEVRVRDAETQVSEFA